MSRIGIAFRAFFAILGGSLPSSIASHFGYTKAAKRAPEPTPQSRSTTDGALQLLAILQRDARLIDFLQEDISQFTDEQVGAAVRNVHSQSRAALSNYLKLAPVIDGVEATFTNASAAGDVGKSADAVKFIGNLPPKGRPTGGILRHRGWRADSISLPSIHPSQNLNILAPAELEVE